MSAFDLFIPTRTIDFRGQNFEVRGIAMPDVMMAVKDYGPQLATLFAKVQSGELETTDVRGAVVELAQELPDVIAAIIALAADAYTPERVAVFRKLPVPVQAEAIEAVFHETFASEADVKKLMESLNRMLAAGSGALAMMNAPASTSGTGGSVAH